MIIESKSIILRNLEDDDVEDLVWDFSIVCMLSDICVKPEN
jgi:hypothetical protein